GRRRRPRAAVGGTRLPQPALWAQDRPMGREALRGVRRGPDDGGSGARARSDGYAVVGPAAGVPALLHQRPFEVLWPQRLRAVPVRRLLPGAGRGCVRGSVPGPGRRVQTRAAPDDGLGHRAAVPDGGVGGAGRAGAVGAEDGIVSRVTTYSEPLPAGYRPPGPRGWVLLHLGPGGSAHPRGRCGWAPDRDIRRKDYDNQ